MKRQVAADWVEAALKAFVDDSRVRIAVLLHPTGQVLGQFGFTRDGALHTALSGAEWARLTLALAASYFVVVILLGRLVTRFLSLDA